MSNSNLQRWHEVMQDKEKGGLSDLLHQDVVFYSPVVHTPQHGKELTLLYLSAAGQTLGNDTFKYVREFDCGDRAVLEFETVMNGIIINGIDMIEWDENGLITDFKVMVRPLKAIQQVHASMMQMLELLKSGSA